MIGGKTYDHGVETGGGEAGGADEVLGGLELGLEVGLELGALIGELVAVVETLVGGLGGGQGHGEGGQLGELHLGEHGDGREKKERKGLSKSG